MAAVVGSHGQDTLGHYFFDNLHAIHRRRDVWPFYASVAPVETPLPLTRWPFWDKFL